MRFGTYMIIGSLISGLVYGGFMRSEIERCPNTRFELDWTFVQLAVAWPALPVMGFYLTGTPKQPRPACKE